MASAFLASTCRFTTTFARKGKNLCTYRRCRALLRRPPTIRCTATVTAVSPSIKVLPLAVVQRIASGEIIRGASCVVRELVENAIDAGATRIEVDINTGSNSITVRDDGHGIPPNEMENALLCNATSKLRDVPGLDTISTLGFRGQGLWAVATVAAGGFELISRHTNEHIGISTKSGPRAMAVGSVARAHGVEPWGDVRSVRTWLELTALSQRGTSFSLVMDGKSKWRCGSATSGKTALARAMKRDVEDFREASAELPDGKGTVHISVGVPGLVTAKTARWLVVVVNGRAVRMPALTNAIRDALCFEANCYPAALIECNLDPSKLNWNVSPIKEELGIRCASLQLQLNEAAVCALREALKWSPVNVDDDNSILKIAGAGASELRKIEPADEDRVSIGWSNYRIVSQLLSTYILVESDEGITLVEQHIADERTMYERFLKSWKSSFRKLEVPVKLPDDMPTENIFNLVSLGFDADDGWIRSAPAALREISTDQLLALGNEQHTVESACAKLSCDNAVRNGTTLTKARMRKIVEGLASSKNARTCPHGRRIFVPLSANALATLFGRRGA